MPYFGRASEVPAASGTAGAASQSDSWEAGGGDFDVEMLAEYLLDDSAVVPNVFFDFR